MHTPVVVPLTKKVDEMFDFFTNNNARAAAVLNEFGGVEGFVTMKDVLTFIFGQISGDVEGQELYRERDQDTYEVEGDMKLTDFNNLTNFGIEDPRMTTIGGVAFRHLDHLPRVNDSISVEDIIITVLEMDEHRIARVRVSRGSRGDEAAAAGAQTESAVAAEAADEAQGEPDYELHHGSTAESGGDENITGPRQSVNDDTHSGPAGAGDADSNPDRKVVN